MRPPIIPPTPAPPPHEALGVSANTPHAPHPEQTPDEDSEPGTNREAARRADWFTACRKGPNADETRALSSWAGPAQSIVLGR